MTQVRQQNMESHRKLNKERAVRKLLKKITTDKPSDKAGSEVGGLIHVYVTVSDILIDHPMVFLNTVYWETVTSSDDV